MAINNSLKIKIIDDYLSGMKREDIAKKSGISTGSVSAIAEEFEEEIPDIHKMRAMMVKLNAAGNDAKLFYPTIRLYNLIKNLGLTESKAEYIIEIFQEYAFKENYDVSELTDSIINAFEIAERCGSDLEHLESDTHAKEMIKEALEAQIRKLKNDIEFLPHKLNIDLAEFQEYQRNKPIRQKYMNMENELYIKDIRLQLLEDKNKDLNLKNMEKDREIERLNRVLIQQGKREDGYYVGYQDDLGSLDSTDCLLDDSFDDEITH